MKKYDAIIIGGGGGLKLRPIVDLGLKIAVIDKEDLGGTCLNRGCIPSKMLIHPAEMITELNEFKKHNMTVDTDVAINFKDLIERVTNRVGKISQSIADSYDNNPDIDFYNAHARFVSDKVVDVDGEQITADRIFVATGSKPSVPPIEGLKGTPYMTSREALRNKEFPDSMIVIGGGYIGMEIGYFYSALGTKVDYLVRSVVLGNEDREIADEFVNGIKDHGTLHIGVSTKSVAYNDGKFTVTTVDKDGEESSLTADALFVATGVVPNSDDLGLKNTSIEMDRKGYIKVDDHLKTDVDGVYALGDVVGNYFFRHSVNFEGEYLLRTLYKSPSDEAIDYPPMPHAVFSNPQIGGVGKTEEELIADGVDFFKGVNHYKDSAMGGDVLQSKVGLVKLMFDRETKKLLGAHIVGKEAATMIHICIPFINTGSTLDDMLNMIYVHPAFPEVIRNAARKASSNI